GVFDEYDYWAGTVSLVVFALAESIIFSYRFGIDRGWKELTRGADMKVPIIYKPIIKYVTPLMLLIVFLSALITPLNNDWETAFKEEWKLDPSSIVGKIRNDDIKANRSYFADHFESEVSGKVSKVKVTDKGKKAVEIVQNITYYRNENGFVKPVKAAQSALGELVTFDSVTVIKTYNFGPKKEILVQEGDKVALKDPIAKGSFINNIFYINMSRILLLSLFLFVTY